MGISKAAPAKRRTRKSAASAKKAARAGKPAATEGKSSAGKVGRSAATKGKGPGPTAKADAYALAKARPVKLLTGGNPQIAKAEGDAPVQAYIAAMPGWKRDVGRRLDALIVRTVPGVRKAVKWNSPFYGVEGRGWFLSFHVFTHAVKVTFFRGTSLRPVPPGGKGNDARWIDIHEDDLDKVQMATWVKQAAGLTGWTGSLTLSRPPRRSRSQAS